jgi:hypothetical protein
MAMDLELVHDFVESIKEPPENPNTTYSARVTRKDTDGTVYVRIAGSDKETPVAYLSSDVKRGDSVNVTWRNNKLYIEGNYSDPAAGMERVQKVERETIDAKGILRKSEQTLSKAEKSIVSDTTYYLATSYLNGVTREDSPETYGTWTETVQTITSVNRYLWTYHKLDLLNGNSVETDPVITGVYGDRGQDGTDGTDGTDGNDGLSILKAQTQYRLSTSSQSIVGGSWSDELTFSSGYYIWTREKVTRSDNSVVYSEAVYNQALTEACELSYNTAQYFWNKTTGGTQQVPTGAYVTEVPRETYEQNPTLGALLLRSGGIYLRQGLAILAQWLTSGATIYDANGNKLAEFLSTGVNLYNGGKKAVGITSNSLDFYDTNGNFVGSISYPDYTASFGKTIRVGSSHGTYKYASADFHTYESAGGEIEITAEGGTDSQNYEFGTVNIQPDFVMMALRKILSGAVQESRATLGLNGLFLTGNLYTKDDTINHIGKKVSAASESISAVPDSWTSGTQYITLSKGSWIITASATIQTTTTDSVRKGIRLIYTDSQQMGAVLPESEVRIPSTITGENNLQTTYLAELDRTTNFAVQAFLGNGSTSNKTFTTYLSAMRIG